MAEFREILAASDEKLVQLFYRIKPSAADDFIAKINHAAGNLGVNHTQLVCALGFNRNIRDLTDILSIVGFNSYKLLSYRRDELFVTDTYRELDIDNVLDIYTERIEDDALLEQLRELLPNRLDAVERKIQSTADASSIMSYKMEIHAIYGSGIATREFAESRTAMDIGEFRMMTDEIQMIVAEEIIPPSNLFFLDTLLADEKEFLLETGTISDAMIRNRLQNTDIEDDERELLEQYV